MTLTGKKPQFNPTIWDFASIFIWHDCWKGNVL